MTAIFTLTNDRLFLEFASMEPSRLDMTVLESETLSGKRYKNLGLFPGDRHLLLEAELTPEELALLEAEAITGEELGLSAPSGAYKVFIKSVEHKRNSLEKRRASIDMKVTGEL